MFGKPHVSPNGSPPTSRRASDVAKIDGKGLVQVVVTNIEPFEFYLFLNDKIVPQEEVESLSLSIEAAKSGGDGIVAALSRYVTSLDGKRTSQFLDLFPATVEIVAVGRRVSVTCTDSSSIDSVYISLGLRPDGAGSELSGAKSLRVLITDGILDGKLTWNDGEIEDLFPQG